MLLRLAIISSTTWYHGSFLRNLWWILYCLISLWEYSTAKGFTLQFLKGNCKIQGCVNSMGCLWKYSEHFQKFLDICSKLNQVLHKKCWHPKKYKILFISLTQWNLTGRTECLFELLYQVRSFNTLFLLSREEITYQIILKHLMKINRFRALSSPNKVLVNKGNTCL